MLGRIIRRASLVATAVTAFAALGSAVESAAAAPIKKLPLPSAIADPIGLTLSHNGHVLYVASSESGVIAIPLANVSAPSNLVPGAGADGVAVSSNSTDLYVSNFEDGVDDFPLSATGVSVPNPVSAGSFAFGEPVGLALNPTGSELLITNYVPGSVLIADTADDTVSAAVADPDGDLDGCASVVFSPNGKALYIGEHDGLAIAAVSNSSSGPVYTVTRRVRVDANETYANFGVVTSRDGKVIYTSITGNPTESSAGGNAVLAISAKTHKVVNRFKHFSGPSGLAITASGDDLYVANVNSGAIDEMSLSALITKPKISGKPKAGRILHAHATPSNVGSAKVKESYHWLANGHPINHATKSKLMLGAGEKGKHISVRVTASTPGLKTTSLVSARTGAVS